SIAKYFAERMQAGDLKLNFPLPEGETTGKFGMPIQAKWAWLMAHDPGITIEPASRISLVFGLACSQTFLLPAAYYLVSRFPDDFESAVLHAVNGGGHNLARASVTGALSGALVGLSGIPPRFLTGLKDSARYQSLAAQVAEAGVAVGVG
ncbi:MAG: ADP-ribosylglycohydrolase family protein, partial [bacterium]